MTLFRWWHRRESEITQIRKILTALFGELAAIRQEQQKGFERMAGQISPLAQAVSDLKASISAEIAAVLAKLNNPNPDVAQAISDLQSLKVTVDAETTSLS